MSYPMLDSPRHNRMLAALPLEHYARLAEQLTPVDCQAGQFIGQPGKPVEHVYFPTTCTASLVSTTRDGETSELALVGRDGLLGVSLILGGETMNHRTMVQSSGRAWRMGAADFQQELRVNPALHQLALGHVQALLVQMAQSIVCSRHHAISQRLSFWLLSSLDALSSDHLRVTHENIASMLGVRRESVTQALGKFQADGWVSNSRGKITIHDRAGLASQVCECFGIVQSETRRIFERMGQLDGCSSAYGSTARTIVLPLGDGVVQPQVQDHEWIEDGQALLQKYQDVYDFAPVGMASLDEQGRVIGTNLAGAILLGLQRSNHTQPMLTSLLDDGSCEVFMAFHQEVLSGKCRRHCEVSLPASGHRAQVVLRLDATTDESGQEVRLVMTDITAEHQRMATSLAQQRCQQALLDHAPFMLWGQDEAGRLVVANASFKAWMEATPSAMNSLQGQDLPEWVSAAQQVAETGGLQELPLDLRGQTRWMEWHQVAQTGPDQPAWTLGYARDITERKRQEQCQDPTAAHDRLTDWYNRLQFMSRLQERHAELRRDSRAQAWLVLLHLDDLKRIHEQFGQVPMEGLLLDFSHRLQACFQEADCVAHLEGNEFGVLLHQPDAHNGPTWAERVHAQVTGIPFKVGTRLIGLHASLGAAPLWARDDSAQEALWRAQNALYQVQTSPQTAELATSAFTVGYAGANETADLFHWTAAALPGGSTRMAARG